MQAIFCYISQMMLLTLPNVLTMSRVAIIPVFVSLFFLESATGQWIACGLFVLASVTDFFDGYLARLRGRTSAFGTFLDPVADKLLIAAALLLMVGFDQIGGTTIIPTVVILCREILVSGLREYLASISVRLPVSRLAKWKTTVQMIAIGFLIVGNDAHPAVPASFPVLLIGEVGLWIAAVVTLITGSNYMRTGLRHMDDGQT